MNTIFHYPVTIKEQHLDTFGHVNNAAYLVLFEEARWDLLVKNSYSIDFIKNSGLGPTILEISLLFKKEIRNREHLIIETETLSYDRKIGKLSQKMLRDGELCCTALFTIGLFSLKERKLVLPTFEWSQALGLKRNHDSL